LKVGAEPSDASARKLVDDTRRRGVVSRLRQRYGEAQGLVVREESYPAPHAHLEWILGTRRNPGHDEAAFDTGVSELVVLWLQDLAQDLDIRVLPSSASGSDASASAAADCRQAAAHHLRTATSDFADAFLSPRRDASGPA
jgi:hypothetical protein